MAKLISILILSFIFSSAYAGESNTFTRNAKDRKEVPIINLKAPLTRSSVELVRLFQDDAKLEAFFYDALGSTQITVYNHYNMCVYHTVIDTKAEERTVIDLSLYPKGSYKITFTTDKNSFCGEFKL